MIQGSNPKPTTPRPSDRAGDPLYGLTAPAVENFALAHQLTDQARYASAQDGAIPANAGPAEQFAEGIIGHQIERVLYARLMDVTDMAVDDPKRKAAAKRTIQAHLRDLVKDMRYFAPLYQTAAANLPLPDTGHEFERWVHPDKPDSFQCSCGEQMGANEAGARAAFGVHLAKANHRGPLRTGQVWQHTTGDRMTVLALNVQTVHWGRAAIAEDDDGTIRPVANDDESLVNWSCIGISSEVAGK